jgi:hypothetical protein
MKKPLNSPEVVHMVAVTEQPQFLMKSLVLYEKTTVVNGTPHPELLIKVGEVTFHISRHASGVQFAVAGSRNREGDWRSLVRILNRYQRTFQRLERVYPAQPQL